VQTTVRDKYNCNITNHKIKYFNLEVLVYIELTTPSNNLIVVFYLKRLIEYNIRTINISVNCQISYRLLKFKDLKGVGVIRVNFGPISETVYIDIILNTIIER
jgi:hypothetical protein